MSKSIEWKECEDRRFHIAGTVVAGVDEVGRGCLAGPVYAAAVTLDIPELLKLDSEHLRLIRDSKTLSSKQRQLAVKIIENVKRETQIAFASVEEIESMGILNASLRAMQRALDACELTIDHVLIDGNQKITWCNIDQTAVVAGDSRSFAIAAASILAKEARDQYMRQVSEIYPQYGFERHVGYGTKFHIEQIKVHGVTPVHRKTFAPISQWVIS